MVKRTLVSVHGVENIYGIYIFVWHAEQKQKRNDLRSLPPQNMKEAKTLLYVAWAVDTIWEGFHLIE